MDAIHPFGYSSTLMAVGGVSKSIVPPISVVFIISSKYIFSSTESNAKECSLAEVPLARPVLRLMLWVRYAGQFCTWYSQKQFYCSASLIFLSILPWIPKSGENSSNVLDVFAAEESLSIKFNTYFNLYWTVLFFVVVIFIVVRTCSFVFMRCFIRKQMQSCSYKTHKQMQSHSSTKANTWCNTIWWSNISAWRFKWTTFQSSLKCISA